MKNTTKKNPLDMPYIDNYPELRDWLRKHQAFCQWQVKSGSSLVECWQLGKRQAIIVVHANQHGWDIFTPGSSLEIGNTLLDAEQRLGLESQ